jgi:hypothetical protein
MTAYQESSLRRQRAQIGNLLTPVETVPIVPVPISLNISVYLSFFAF